MSLRAGDLINAARDFQLSGSELEVTDKMMLRALARAEKVIYHLVSPINEDALADTQVFDAEAIQAALDEETPLELVEHFTVLEGVVRYSLEIPGVPFFILPARTAAEMTEYFPAGKLIGRKLHLIRRFPAFTQMDEWAEVEDLTVRLVPVPPAPEDLDALLSLPDMAEDYLVLALADFMLGAMGERSRATTDQHLAARDSLVVTLASQDATTTWRVRDLC